VFITSLLRTFAMLEIDEFFFPSLHLTGVGKGVQFKASGGRSCPAASE
jgi:hypothetical protein